jgi:hypothetical protein
MKKTTRRVGKKRRTSTKKRQAQIMRQRDNKRMRALDLQAEKSHIVSVPAPPLAVEKKTPRHIQVFGWLYTALVFVFGCYFDSFSSVHPHVSVEPLEVLDPKNPLSVPFKITNETFYALYDIRYSCVQVQTIAPVGSEVAGNIFLPTDRIIKELGPHSSATKSCSFIGDYFGRSDVRTVDFMVTVSFYPWFFPSWKKVRLVNYHRFTVVYDKEGRARIHPQPPVSLPSRPSGIPGVVPEYMDDIE